MLSFYVCVQQLFNSATSMHQSLQILRLSDTGLDSMSFDMLSLPKLSQLVELSLAGADLQQTAAHSFLSLFHSCRSLQILDLGACSLHEVRRLQHCAYTHTHTHTHTQRHTLRPRIAMMVFSLLLIADSVSRSPFLA